MTGITYCHFKASVIALIKAEPLSCVYTPMHRLDSIFVADLLMLMPLPVTRLAEPPNTNATRSITNYTHTEHTFL